MAFKATKQFYVWARWRRRGGLPADKPAGLPLRIPAVWWKEYKRRGYKPIKPKPSSLGVFAEKGLWFAWPFHSAGWTPAQVAGMAVTVGAKWVALEINEPANRERFPALQEACKSLGVSAGLWGHLSSASQAAKWSEGSPFYIAQNEGLGQTEDNFPSLFKQAAPGVELALVASPWEGLPDPRSDPVGWERWTKPWIGQVVLCEAYIGSNPSGGTPALQAAMAAHRGFTRRACVLEAHRGKGWPLSAYNREEIAPDNYGTRKAASVYLRETCSDIDLEWFKAL